MVVEIINIDLRAAKMHKSTYGDCRYYLKYDNDVFIQFTKNFYRTLKGL